MWFWVMSRPVLFDFVLFHYFLPQLFQTVNNFFELLFPVKINLDFCTICQYAVSEVVDSVFKGGMEWT